MLDEVKGLANCEVVGVSEILVVVMMVHFLLLEDLGEDGHLRFARFLNSFQNVVHIINSRLRPLNLDFGHHEVDVQEIFLFKLNGYC